MRLGDAEREEFLARVFPVWFKEPTAVSKPVHTAEQFEREALRQSNYDEEQIQFYGEIF